ncbi:hypothetical protein HY388_01600 [Candidatus Daviesbacteria bacterium]|nr:hypothetical protein [Candidatus Daviesbacteria bacterium]
MPEVDRKSGKQLETLIAWSSPMRPFRKRNAEWYRTVAAIVIALVVVLFFIKEWLLLAVVLALTFVVYVLATIAPDNIEHKITGEGIVSAGHSYLWDELRTFWFDQKDGQDILYIDTKLKFPGRLIILLSQGNKEKIKDYLSRQLSFREIPEQSFLDRAAGWMQKHLPLEEKK